eukprot:CFRG3733T1
MSWFSEGLSKGLNTANFSNLTSNLSSITGQLSEFTQNLLEEHDGDGEILAYPDLKPEPSGDVGFASLEDECAWRQEQMHRYHEGMKNFQAQLRKLETLELNNADHDNFVGQNSATTSSVSNGAEAELARLRAENLDLEKKLTFLAESHQAEMQEIVRVMSTQKKALLFRQSNAEVDMSSSTDHDEFARLTEKNAFLSQQVNEFEQMNDDIDEIKRTNNSLEQRVQLLTDENERLNTQIECFQDSSLNSTSVPDSASSCEANLKTLVEVLQEKLTEQENSREDDYRELARERENSEETFRKEIAYLRAKVESTARLEDTIQTEEQLSHVTQKLLQEQKTTGSKVQAQYIANEELTRIQGELSKKSAEIVELKDLLSKRERIEHTEDTNTTENLSSHDELQELNVMLEVRKDELANLTEKVDRLENKEMQSKDTISQLDAVIAAKEEVIVGLESTLITVQGTVDMFEKEKVGKHVMNESENMQMEIESTPHEDYGDDNMIARQNEAIRERDNIIKMREFTIVELQEALDDIERQGRETGRKLIHVTDEMENMRVNEYARDQNISDLEELNKTLTEQLTSSHTSTGEKDKAELPNVVQENQHVRKEMEEMRMCVAKNEDRAAEFAVIIAKAQGQLGSYGDSVCLNTAVERELATRDDQIKRLGSLNKDLSLEMESIRESVGVSEHKSAELEEVNATLREELAALSECARNSQAVELVQIMQESEHIKSEMENMRTLLDYERLKSTTVSEENDKFRREMENMRTQEKESCRHISEVEGLVAELREEIGIMNEKMVDIRMRASEGEIAQVRVGELEQEMMNKEIELCKLVEMNEYMAKEIENMRMREGEGQRRVAELEEMNFVLNEQTNAAIESTSVEPGSRAYTEMEEALLNRKEDFNNMLNMNKNLTNEMEIMDEAVSAGERRVVNIEHLVKTLPEQKGLNESAGQREHEQLMNVLHENTRLHQEMEDTRTGVSASEIRIAELEELVTTLRVQMGDKNIDVNTNSRESASDVAMVATVRTPVGLSELEDEIVNMNEQLETAKRENIQVVQEMEHVRMNLDLSECRVAELEDLTKALSGQVDGLTRNASMSIEVKQEMNRKDDMLAELVGLNEKMASELDDIRTVVRARERRVAELEELTVTLKEQIMGLSENMSDGARIVEIEEKMEKKELQLVKLQEYLMESEENHTTEALAREKIIDDLQAKLDSIKESIEIQSKQSSTSTQQLEIQVANLRTQLETAEEQNNTLEEKWTVLRQYHEQQEASLKNLRLVIASNETERDEELALATGGLKKTIRQLEIEMQKAKAEVRLKHEEILEIQTAMEHLQIAHHQHQSRTNLTHGNSTEMTANDENATLRQQLIQLHQQLVSYQTEMARGIMSGQSEMIDKSLMRNFVITYITSDKSRETLQVLAKLLDFDNDDMIKAGLTGSNTSLAGRGIGYLTSFVPTGLMTAPVYKRPSDVPIQSFAESFVDYLLEQGAHGEIKSTPAKSGNVGSRNTLVHDQSNEIYDSQPQSRASYQQQLQQLQQRSQLEDSVEQNPVSSQAIARLPSIPSVRGDIPASLESVMSSRTAQ